MDWSGRRPTPNRVWRKASRRDLQFRQLLHHEPQSILVVGRSHGDSDSNRRRGYETLLAPDHRPILQTPLPDVTGAVGVGHGRTCSSLQHLVEMVGSRRAESGSRSAARAAGRNRWGVWPTYRFRRRLPVGVAGCSPRSRAKVRRASSSSALSPVGICTSVTTRGPRALSGRDGPSPGRQPENRRGLGPGRNLERLGAALQQRNLDLDPQRRLGHAQLESVDQVVALPDKVLAGLGPDLHVQISGHPPAPGMFPPSGEAQPGAVRDPGRNLDADLAVAGDGTGTPASRARLRDDGPMTGAGRAGAERHHRPEKPTSGDPHGSGPAAGRTGDRRRARSRAFPTAAFARQRGAERDFGLSAEGGARQVNLDPDQDVATSIGGRSPSLGVEEPAVAENRSNQVVEPAEAREKVTEVEGFSPVVRSTPVGIGEDLVRLGDAPETRLGGGIPGVGIGMALASQAAGTHS